MDMKEHRQDALSAAMQAPGLDRKTALLVLAMTAVLAVGCLLGGWKLRQDAVEEEQANLRRLAVSLSEHTALAFREIDLVLRQTSARLTPETLEPTHALHRYLQEQYAHLPQGQALMVFGPDGQMLGHSREFPSPLVNAADRDYFTAQKTGGDALYLSVPMRNRVNNRWMISLSRRLTGPGNSFAGVLMAAVELQYFSGIYRSLNLPAGAHLELRRGDGAVLVDYPHDEKLHGTQVHPWTEDKDDLVATAEVPAFPMTMRLTLPQAVALKSWRNTMAASAAAVMAVLACALAFAAKRRTYVRQLTQRTQLLQQSTLALRESESRFRTIVETANEGICTMDATSRLTYVNEVLAEMLGHEAAEMPGRPVSDFLFPEDLTEDAAQLGQQRQSERSRFEWRLRHKSGHAVWVTVSSSPLKDEAGTCRGSLAMLTDISTRKEEEKFREGIEGVLRHDLRSPLVSMQYIPLLLREAGSLSDRQQYAVEELTRLVQRMLRMIDAYLGISRIEKQTFTLETSQVDLATLLREVLLELEKTRGGGLDRVALTINGAPPEAAGPVMVLCDGVLCHAMFSNLLKNALEATPAGSAVTMALRDLGKEVEVTLHNVGAVPEAIRSRFAQKYVTSGKSRGTGLGAYSARLIAEVHHGQFELDASEPGATTIRVRLPRLG